MSQSIVIANNLRILQNGKEVLGNVSFTLERGKTLIITGASGSGKTLLALALAKKLYTQGTLGIHYDNEDGRLSPSTVLIEQRYSMKNRGNLTSGFYYQQRFNSSDAQDSYTVMEELRQISSSQQDIDLLLSELQLAERKDAPVLQLSSGEHKRFQLVKAFLQPSQLMILDEPFIGLDTASRQKLYAIIDEKAAKGTAFVIISGSHHPFPESTVQVLELHANGAHVLADKQQFKPGVRRSAFTIDLDKISWEPSPLVFENALRLVDVSVRYGEKTILNHINWTVRKGEKWLLQGHNGAGKSTLLSLLTGDNPQAYANEIYLFDKRRGRGESIWDVKKPIGFVSPEIFAYYDKNLSVHDTIAGGLFDTMGLYRKLSDTQEQKVAEWLAAFHLTPVRLQRLGTLSSGQQRLVLLASALVKSPSLLLLDEPCQGLDEVQTREFVAMVDALCEKIETTILYISHYENEIPRCVDHIMRLDHGNATTELQNTNSELRKEEKCEI